MSIKLLEIRSDFLRVVCLPELKVSTTLEHLTHTLWLADTWHFYHDTALLTFQFLDVRLNNTELIDTGADNVERVVDGILYRSADSLLYLCVAALRRNLTLQLLGSEHFSEFMTWCALVISVNEK